MNLSKSDVDDLLAEIERLDKNEVRQPGDIDAYQYSLARGIKNRQTAERWLDDLVDQGILVKIPKVYDPETGRRINVWRKKPAG